MKQSEGQIKKATAPLLYALFLRSANDPLSVVFFQCVFLHEQCSYFSANLWYFKKFTLPPLLRTKSLTHKMSMIRILSLRTSGMTVLEGLDIVPMNPTSAPSEIRLFCHPSPKPLLISCLFSFTPKTHHLNKTKKLKN